MNDQVATIQILKDKIKQFVQEREWKQFHDAKNLSMAIATEAAELMEYFRWLNNQESDQVMQTDNRSEIEYEIVDIIYMALCFCNAYNIDLTTVMLKKMEINAQRYPVAKAKGCREKYNQR